MKKMSKATYKKYLKDLKKAELERAEEDKDVWRNFIDGVDLLEDLSQTGKADAWLRQVMINGKSIFHPDDWYSQFTVNEFADQEALIYFISRGVDCSNNIKNMLLRLKEHKKSSEDFWRFLETLSDKELRLLGLQKKRRPRKIDKDASYYEALWRSSYSLANDDEVYQVVSMIKTLDWCDIGGYDLVWKEYVRRLNEDVTRGGEIDPEIANQTLFHVCRSDFAIELMRDNLLKLLDIVEMPDYQLSIPWHRWNHDYLSRSAGIEINSIYVYAANIAFAEKRLRRNKLNKELVNQALKWLLETQEENGAWKTSTLMDEPSIMSTCMVIHALALNKPRGWKLAASQACDWLLSMQDEFGFWYEAPFPPTDPVYLTVLVLDTLNLVRGSSDLTFGINKDFSHLSDQDTSMALSQNFYVEGELVMGDNYKVGDNKGGIQNIGKFKNTVSNITQRESKEFINQLAVLTDVIRNSQHLSETEKDEHMEILSQLRDELAKPEPNKTLLKMLGNGLLKILQVVPDLVKAAATIAPYINNLPK